MALWILGVLKDQCIVVILVKQNGFGIRIY